MYHLWLPVHHAMPLSDHRFRRSLRVPLGSQRLPGVACKRCRGIQQVVWRPSPLSLLMSGRLVLERFCHLLRFEQISASIPPALHFLICPYHLPEVGRAFSRCGLIISRHGCC